YHSTVMIDGEEQNTTLVDLPFILGDQARPTVLEWRMSDVRDTVVAEHLGYPRLRRSVVHRRTIEFDKADKYWLIKDELAASGKHDFAFLFHIAPGLALENIDESTMTLKDDEGRSLIIRAIGIGARAE